jgi:hypothetical protein
MTQMPHAAPQPEALATFAEAARSGTGQKPADVGLNATAATASLPGDTAQEGAAATAVLREGITGEDAGAAEQVFALPDRSDECPERR